MTAFTPTTPMSVFKTPIPLFDAVAGAFIPPDLFTSMTAFDTCLALVHRSIAANADVAGWAGDPALSSFSVEAADAEARADMALEAFQWQPGYDHDLCRAAWLLLLLFADDGRDLEMLAARSETLRYNAMICASLPLPGNSYKSGRMLVAADLLDHLIALARDDMGTSEMHADGLPSVGVRPVRTDIDWIDTFSTELPEFGSEPDLVTGPAPDVAPDFEPA